MRLFFTLLAVVALAGCATTKSPSEMANLQIKVSQLERAVEDRDQEISDLKYEIEDLKNQLEDSPAVPTRGISTSVSEEVESAPVMATGADGEIIRVAVSSEDVQRALKNAGYYTGAVDGKIGSKTKQAIADFQRDHGLQADGIIGKKTWTELKKFLE